MHTGIHASSGDEPTIPVFERVEKVHALDRAANVIGPRALFWTQIWSRNSNHSTATFDDQTDDAGTFTPSSETT
jgi:hypothetical protein